MSAATRLSLIVATRNRCEILGRFLAELEYQSPGLNWELVLVDNGSVDGTRELIRTSKPPFQMHALCEQRPGKSRALNTGIRHASGSLLVFSDDDVHPQRDWLAAFASAAQRHPGASVFGGRILVNAKSVPGWIARSCNLQEMLLSEHNLGDREHAYPHGRYPIGPNMAMRCSALDGVGDPWPVDMGPGTRLPLGDERAFLSQVSPCDAADRIYVPSAVVVHSAETEQTYFRGAMRRCYLGGLAAGKLSRRFPCLPGPGNGTWVTAWERIRAWSSFREAACALTRAVGVAIGALVPRFLRR
jgi:glycosyltransferase involved in cell wall biosynthesis